MNWKWAVGYGLAVGGAAVAGCASSRPPASTAAAPVHTTMNAPTLQPVASATYHDHGISFQYPADWQPAKGKTAVFRVVRPGGGADLNLDVPSVPAIFAGLVNPNAVATNYAKDVKAKEIPDATVTYADLAAGGATARTVTLTGHDPKGAPYTDQAIALTHHGRVFILSSNSRDAAGSAAGKAALEAAAKSVQWDS